MNDLRRKIQQTLEAHQIEWMYYEAAWTCGCDEWGDLPYMPFRSDAEAHQADMILRAIEVGKVS